MWHAKRNEPIMPSQIMRSMGWSKKDTKKLVATLSERRLIAFLGNAMHLSSIYMVTLAALACTGA